VVTTVAPGSHHAGGLDQVLDDAAVDVGAHGLGGRALEGVSGVDTHPARAAHDGLGHVLGPLVGQLVGEHLDRRRVLGEDRRAERPGGLGGLPGQGLAVAAGGHGADLGQLAVALGLHGVGRFPFGRDMGLILRELVGGGVAPLRSGAGQDLVGGAAVLAASLPKLVEQVGHGVPRLAAAPVRVEAHS
jgi:hypothetical protein